MQLNLNDISFTYPSSPDPVLQCVTVAFPEGWTGIVGNNGCGKSTLARIACGLLQPGSGSVGPALVCTYCEQYASTPPTNLEDFALSYDGDAITLRDALRIEEDWAWRYETLSGGQQKRLQVACALHGRPDVLVVDEPTNHVDARTRTTLIDALHAFTGVGMLISHDRELLDALCTHCLFMSGGRAVLRPGAYSAGAAQEAAERRAAASAREQAKRERDRLQREVRRRTEEAACSKGRRSARGLAPGDHDTREKIGRALVSGKDGVVGRLSARMGARLARQEMALDAVRVEKSYDADVWLDAEPSRRDALVRLRARTLPLGEVTLHVPSLVIGPTDHIALTGDNGCGKTTLVREIVQGLPEDVACCYIPQEPSGAQARRAIDRLHALGRQDRGLVLSVVAQLNSRPERLLDGTVISPGELRKLMLAVGILDRPQLIVMDEPTNHLDLTSTEALQRLLAAYPGALLLVSHDVRLLEATCPIRWEVRP